MSKQRKAPALRGKIEKIGQHLMLTFSKATAEAAGLALGDEVSMEVSGGKLVVERVRSATSAEDVALTLLGPRGVSPLGSYMATTRHFPNVRPEEVRAVLGRLVDQGRARVDGQGDRPGAERKA